MALNFIGSSQEVAGLSKLGQGAHAEGIRNEASGYCSHVEGSSTVATGANAHAEGSGTTATGAAAHAEGTSSTASGANSHAEGLNSTASHNYSSAGGYYGKSNMYGCRVRSSQNPASLTALTSMCGEVTIGAISPGTANSVTEMTANYQSVDTSSAVNVLLVPIKTAIKFSLNVVARSNVASGVGYVAGWDNIVGVVTRGLTTGVNAYIVGTGGAGSSSSKTPTWYSDATESAAWSIGVNVNTTSLTANYLSFSFNTGASALVVSCLGTLTYTLLTTSN